MNNKQCENIDVLIAGLRQVYADRTFDPTGWTQHNVTREEDHCVRFDERAKCIEDLVEHRYTVTFLGLIPLLPAFRADGGIFIRESLAPRLNDYTIVYSLVKWLGLLAADIVSLRSGDVKDTWGQPRSLGHSPYFKKRWCDVTALDYIEKLETLRRQYREIA